MVRLPLHRRGLNLRRFVRRRPGERDTAGHELRYWQKTGLGKGTGIYESYLRLFGLRKEDLRGLSVCDYGCGPFGGVLSVLDGVAAYPMDVLAGEYNELGHSPWPILAVDGHRTPLEDGACDVCFCTNALDHVPKPAQTVKELARIVKPGGSLYLHLHLRRLDQLNKAHRYPVSEVDVRRWVDGAFSVESLGVDVDWPNDEPGLTMLYAHLVRV